MFAALRDYPSRFRFPGFSRFSFFRLLQPFPVRLAKLVRFALRRGFARFGRGCTATREMLTGFVRTAESRAFFSAYSAHGDPSRPEISYEGGLSGGPPTARSTSVYFRLRFSLGKNLS